jgi:tRNA pseudouridine55 synthase
MAKLKRPKNKVNGWVVLDKPLEVTSTKAVNIVRRAFGAAKAGHSGTLDPLASGMLPIALGEATKTIPYVMDASKDYDFTITWGAETTTDDRQGQVTITSDHRPSRNDIEAVLPKFIGQIKQIPPTYSAIKLDGKRAYDLARNNEEVELKARDALIYALKCHDNNEVEAQFSVTTGKGVYVRSLARDLAQALDTAGHIKTLRRCRVGPFSLDRSISLDFFEKIDNSAVAFEVLHPVLTALDDIPALTISEEDATRLRRGQKIVVDKVLDNLGTDISQHDEADDVVMTALWDGQLIAIVSLRGQTASPSRVFNL